MNILLLNGCPKSNGATANILRSIAESVDQSKYNVETICLGSLDIHYCLGCTSCHHTGKCVQDKDDVDAVMQAMERADCIVIASPSYWGDITGQLKVLIDRCTPYSNTHTPHASLSAGKKGYAIALRTGQNPKECLHIIESIRHFYGHLEIEFIDSMYFCGITEAHDIEPYQNEIHQFAEKHFK